MEEENKNTEVETDVESVETDVPSTEEVNMDESIKDEETTNVSEEEDMKKKKKCEDEDNREAKSFELSHDDVRNLLSKKLDTYDSNGRRNYDIWVMEVFDTYCIYQKWNEVNQYFKAYYTKTENDINIEDTVEVFMMYLTQQELDDLKQEKESYSELQSKYNDVNEKYQKYVKKEEDAKKQEMIDSFAGNLTQEEVEKCIDDISKFTVEEIETKLTLELGRKAKSASALTSSPCWLRAPCRLRPRSTPRSKPRWPKPLNNSFPEIKFNEVYYYERSRFLPGPYVRQHHG